jgi:hypothetical protein
VIATKCKPTSHLRRDPYSAFSTAAGRWLDGPKPQQAQSDSSRKEGDFRRRVEIVLSPRGVTPVHLARP